MVKRLVPSQKKGSGSLCGMLAAAAFALAVPLPAPAGETPLSEAPAAGAYQWPAYSPNLDDNVRLAAPELKPPTRVRDDVSPVAGTIHSRW